MIGMQKMNIARTLYFKQEVKEKNVLLNLDAVQITFIVENAAFVLGFNPMVTERTDKVCIDIQNVAHSKMNGWSDEENSEEQKQFCLEEKLESFYDRGIKSVKGIHMQEVKKSLLAILSGKSSLLIYIDNFEDLDEAFDFQTIVSNESDRSSYVSLISLNSSDNNSRREEFEAMFNKKLDVLCMCWSTDLMNGDCDLVSQSMAYLSVSHSAGFITIWGINILSGQFDLLCGVDIDDDVVEDMSFLSCGKTSHLCLSFRDGRVCLVEFSSLSSEGSSPLRDVTFVWDDQDYIVASGIVYIEDRQMLAIPKNQHLVLLSFDLSEEKRKVFSLQILSVDTRFYISGIIPLTSELIISTFDGFLYKVKLSTDTKLQTEQMQLSWSGKDWNIFGSQSSKNNVYLLVAAYPSKFYCNRIVKQPTLIHVIPITNLENICHLVMNHSGPVYEIYDALCYLKFELGHGNSWPQPLVDHMNEVDDLESLSLQQVKVLRCILSIRLAYLKDDEKDFKDRIIYLIKKTEVLILMNHVQATFGMLYSLNLDSLMSLEKSSLTLMKRFMLNHSTNSNFVLLETFSHEYFEFCPICSGSVNLDDHGKGSCENEHVFARCCQSLMLCTELPYRTCVVCKSSAIQKIDECSLFGSVLSDSCTYCDGQLKLIEGF